MEERTIRNTKEFVRALNELNAGVCQFRVVPNTETSVTNAIEVVGIDSTFSGRITVKYPNDYQWRDNHYFGKQLGTGHKHVFNLLNSEKVIPIPADANGCIGITGFVKAMNELNAGKSYKFETKQGHPDTFIIKGVRKGMTLKDVVIPNGFRYVATGGKKNPVHSFTQRNANGFEETFYLEVG